MWMTPGLPIRDPAVVSELMVRRMVQPTPFIESLSDKGGHAAGKYKCLWWKKLPLEGEHK
jgi:hypothetical protein